MAIENIEVFTRKGTVRTIVYVRDDDGDLVNCTNVNITYQDEEGTKLNVVTANVTATGVYEDYLYTNATFNVGEWRIEANIIDGTKRTFAHGGFTLEEGL